MPYILKFIGVMIMMIFADIAWAQYFITVGDRQSLKAGIWAALIYVFGMLVTTHYINDWTLGIAAVVGSFIGTYITVEFKRRRENGLRK